MTAPVLASLLLAAAAPPRPSQVAVELTPLTESVAPGSDTELFATFTIAKPWHIYWDGQNDTGIPPSFKWTLPPGFTISAVEFPAPKRNVLPGNILDYIYEQQMVCRFKVHIPEEAAAGSVAKLAAKIEWLECADVCLPGSGQYAIAVNVATEASKPTTASSTAREAFAARNPHPASELKDLAVAPTPTGVTITVPGAEHLEFYPRAGARSISDQLHDGSKDADHLDLKFADAGEKADLGGILAVYRTKQGLPVYYDLHGVTSGKQSEPEKAPGAK